MTRDRPKACAILIHLEAAVATIPALPAVVMTRVHPVGETIPALPGADMIRDHPAAGLVVAILVHRLVAIRACRSSP